MRGGAKPIIVPLTEKENFYIFSEFTKVFSCNHVHPTFDIQVQCTCNTIINIKC